MKRTATPTGKTELATTVTADDKLNKPDKKEKELLEFLYGDGQGLKPRPTSPTPGTGAIPTVPGGSPAGVRTDAGPIGPDGNPIPPGIRTNAAPDAAPARPAPAERARQFLSEADKAIDPDLVPEHNLATVFRKYDALQVNPATMGEWFIPNPPATLEDLHSDQIKAIVFKPQRVWLMPSGVTNRQTNPHVWDLFIEPSSPTGDERFTNIAYKLTRDDSSILALAAAASENANKQALLYKDIAHVLLEGSKTDPGIFYEWIKAQNDVLMRVPDPHDPNLIMEVPMLSYTKDNDAEWVDRYGGDKNYQQVPLENNEEIPTPEYVTQVWADRLQELQGAIDKGEFTLYQHRWIELMSKMMDMKKVMALIKSKAGPAAPSAESDPAVTPPAGTSPTPTSSVEPRPYAMRTFDNLRVDVSAAQQRTDGDSGLPPWLSRLARRRGTAPEPQAASPIRLPTDAEPPAGSRATEMTRSEFMRGDAFADFKLLHQVEEFAGDLKSNYSSELIPEGNGKSFVLNRYDIKDEQITALFAEEKGQDALGIGRRADGIVNVIVTDGVQEGSIPEAASRTVRDVMLTGLQTTDLSSATLEDSYLYLQNLNIPKWSADHYDRVLSYHRQRAEAAGADINNAFSSNEDVKTYNHYLYDYTQKHEKGKFAKTTVAAAQYNKGAENLKVAVKGDGLVVVFRKNGPPEIFSNPTDSKQIGYAPGEPYTHEAEVTESIDLHDDDVVMVTSDGIEKYYNQETQLVIDDLQQALVEARNAGTSSRLDQALTDRVRQRMQNTPVGDDFTLAFIHHKKEADDAIGVTHAAPEPVRSAGGTPPDGEPPAPPVVALLAPDRVAPLTPSGSPASHEPATPLRPLEASAPAPERAVTYTLVPRNYYENGEPKSAELIHQEGSDHDLLATFLNTASILKDGKTPMTIEQTREKVNELRRERGLPPLTNDSDATYDDAVQLMSTIYGLQASRFYIKEWSKKENLPDAKKDITNILQWLDVTYPSKTVVIGIGDKYRSIKQFNKDTFALIDPQYPEAMRILNTPQLVEHIHPLLLGDPNEKNLFFFLRNDQEPPVPIFTPRSTPPSTPPSGGESPAPTPIVSSSEPVSASVPRPAEAVASVPPSGENRYMPDFVTSRSKVSLASGEREFDHIYTRHDDDRIIAAALNLLAVEGNDGTLPMTILQARRILSDIRDEEGFDPSLRNIVPLDAVRILRNSLGRSELKFEEKTILGNPDELRDDAIDILDNLDKRDKKVCLFGPHKDLFVIKKTEDDEYLISDPFEKGVMVMKKANLLAKMENEMRSPIYNGKNRRILYIGNSIPTSATEPAIADADEESPSPPTPEELREFEEEMKRKFGTSVPQGRSRGRNPNPN